MVSAQLGLSGVFVRCLASLAHMPPSERYAPTNGIGRANPCEKRNPISLSYQISCLVSSKDRQPSYSEILTIIGDSNHQ